MVKYLTVYPRGEVIHEAEEQAARQGTGARRGRSVLATLQPPAAPAPLLGPPALAAPRPHAAAAAYLGAARYVAGARIDTSLFHPMPLRPHHGTGLHMLTSYIHAIETAQLLNIIKYNCWFQKPLRSAVGQREWTGRLSTYAETSMW